MALSLVLLCLSLYTCNAHASCSWNITQDFLGPPSAVNPNPGTLPCARGIFWTFAQIDVVTFVVSPMALFQPTYASQPNFGAWQGSEVNESSFPKEGFPAFAKNFGTAALTWSGNKYIPSGAVTTHPGQFHDSLLYWISPYNGSFSVSGSICVIQTPACGNGIAYTVFAGGSLAIWAAIPPLVIDTFDKVFYLGAGDNITLRVSNGGSFDCDTTMVDMTITEILPTTTSTASATTAIVTTSSAISSTSDVATLATTMKSTALTDTTSATSASTLVATSSDAVMRSTSFSSSVTITTTSLRPPSPLPSQPTGILVITQDISITGPWTAPPVVVFQGGTVLVTGIAIVASSVAQVQVSRDEQGSNSQRVDLVKATEIIGEFSAIVVLQPRRDGAQRDGECQRYFVATEQKSQSSYSVLLAAQPTPCAQRVLSTWLVLGIIGGVIGLLMFCIVLLVLFRRTAMRWAREESYDEEYVN